MKYSIIILINFFIGIIYSYGQQVLEIDYSANLENPAVHSYLEEVIYQTGDSSVIDDYRNDGSYRKDCPNYVGIKINRTDIDSVLIICCDDNTLMDSLSFKVAVKNGAIQLYNLIPNRIYRYKVMDGESLLQQGKIYTEGQLRMIMVPGVVGNVRDLGGWKTSDGKRIKYGKIYRGTELNGQHSITDEGISILLELGVGAELDLRAYYNEGCNESVFGFLNEYSTPEGDVATYYYTYDSGQLPEHITNYTYLSRWRKEFQFIVNNLRKGRSIYEHCVQGKDRTGYLSFLLEGLLGIPYNELIKEYELSYFSNHSQSTKSSIDKVYEYIEQLEGETLRDKFNYFFINNLYVLQDDIDYFRQEMLEDSNFNNHINYITTDTNTVDKSIIYDLTGRQVKIHNNLYTKRLLLIRGNDGKIYKVFK